MVGGIIKLEFDPMFHEKLQSGKKTVTFRRGDKKGEYHDYFFVNKKLYMIIGITTDISLFDFVSRHWYEDGFDSPDDAVEWFKQHYFNGDVPEQYGETFKGLTGTFYRFKRMSLGDLQRQIDEYFNEFSLNHWLLKYNLEILSFSEPKDTGYDEEYLKKSMEILDKVDEEFFYDFMEKLFPYEGEEETWEEED